MGDRKNAVSAVLANYRDRSTNYGQHALFDHLPMTVAALAEMGADETHLAAWAERYANRHGLRPAMHAEREARLRWRARIRDLGRSAVFAQHGAYFARGIGAAAFHAAIRAAYAFERSDDDELAAALEAWEREYLPIARPLVEASCSVEASLAELAASPIRTDGRGLIATRMKAVAEDARFAAIAASVPSAADVDALALAAATAFALSGDFTALHVMTGTHAMRVLLRHLTGHVSIVSGFWSAYAAAALVAGTIPTLDAAVLDALRAEAPPDWEPLLARAVAQDDEHVIKSTYTAWRLDCELHDDVYRAAAQRYLSLDRRG